MRKFIVASLMVICASLFATAQEEEPTDSTENEGYSLGSPPEREKVEERVGDSIIVRFRRDTTKNSTTRWFTFGLGVNPVYTNSSFDLPTTPEFYNDWEITTVKSTNVDLGIVQHKLNLVDHKFNLYTGIGFDITKFMFEDNFVIDPDAETWQTSDFDAETKKNRLTTSFIHVPLMLNFESNEKHHKSFRLSAGMFGNLRLGSNQKIKFEDNSDNFLDEDKRKYKEKDNFNQRDLTYGMKGVMGFGPVNLYAKYYMEDMFKDEAAPDLNRLSMGIMIIPF